MSHLPISDSAFVTIPSGVFLMGQENRHLAVPPRRVSVAAFELMKTPVTFSQYDRYCELTCKEKPEDRDWGRDQRPVINASYWNAVDLCEWLSKETGRHYRLPTEAEWEYACRAGAETTFWYANDPDVGLMHCNAERTLPVAQFKANPWGLFDTHGNVWEWCASEYDEDQPGKEEQDASGECSNKTARAVRSGAWFNKPDICRSTFRGYSNPRHKGFDCFGFRLARSL
ncbi:MAG: formylglycine-generating enzyme family protein [Motiliproteus sp.]